MILAVLGLMQLMSHMYLLSGWNIVVIYVYVCVCPAGETSDGAQHSWHPWTSTRGQQQQLLILTIRLQPPL